MILWVMPDMQIGPLGYLLTWLAIAVIAVGALFASGIGGALVWAAFWILVLLAVYGLLSKVVARVT